MYMPKHPMRQRLKFSRSNQTPPKLSESNLCVYRRFYCFLFFLMTSASDFVNGDAVALRGCLVVTPNLVGGCLVATPKF